jgi:hypothetical protein
MVSAGGRVVGFGSAGRQFVRELLWFFFVFVSFVKVKFEREAPIVIRVESGIRIDHEGDWAEESRRAREDSGLLRERNSCCGSRSPQHTNRANSHGPTCSGIIINLYVASESEEDPKIKETSKFQCWC